jgi:TetR/AcrR family transcriptional regulator, regulator of cefoperazone and chloramphenicol sensitivity
MNDDTAKKRESRSDATRTALIMTALRLFGSRGFEATSTREIAAAAKANIGSIAYHFGGKDGLREACAQHIAETIRSVAAPAIGLGDVDTMNPDEAEQRLVDGIGKVVRFIVARPEAGAFVQFVLRELSIAGSSLDILYNGVFEPVHMRLCQLWSRATGDPAESERTRIAVFAMIGQVVYFRIGREAVLRRMGWPDVGAQETAALTDVITNNVRTILRARREEIG